MRLRMVDHCYAEAVLNSNMRTKQEIIEILQTLNLHGTPNGGGDPMPHRFLQEAFKQRGWRCEVLVSTRTLRKHYFDLVKDRVAIEIEFSNRENFYRDYFRFLLAEHEGLIDVGVIVTWDPRLEAHLVESPSSAKADLQQAADDLSWMRNWMRVPVWVIGLS